ncbi:MAG: hypothetical protein GWN58_22835 [Anaerolineae bacterium]|nr:hypothetical protein [Thermoplasmata archaeon]NIV32211.1 hypothetical protein [Anaerolineae bacterium]NIY03663.1 hypothetical protein [Thermoplasmata archaeon]
MSEPEDIEAQLNHSYQLGISGGLEQAARFLLDKAAQHFRTSHDETAKVLRTLHHELLTKAAEARPDDD